MRFPVAGRVALALIISTFVAIPAASISTRQRSDAERVPLASRTTLLVKLDAAARLALGDAGAEASESLAAEFRRLGVTHVRSLAGRAGGAGRRSPLLGWYEVRLERGPRQAERLARLRSSLRAHSAVDIVEPNYRVAAFRVPNDPYYSSRGTWGQPRRDLYNLHRINTTDAWDRSVGSREVTVAIIDSGIDAAHPDLAQNVWRNRGEIAGNSIDDDGNGYIDDVTGWNFFDDSNDTRDVNGHGTHVAGTVAARGNNGIGVVGVSWIASLMPVKFLNQSGAGYATDAIVAMRYAADMGADVALNAWGCECMSRAIDDAVRYLHERGVVTVAASGHHEASVMRFSPASATDAITVAGTGFSDQPRFFNTGYKLDISAPGREILSTKSPSQNVCGEVILDDAYCVASGSSMAAAHVAGVAALLLAANPNLAPEQVRQLLREGARDIWRDGADPYSGYGLVNAARSIRGVSSRPLTPYISSPRNATLLARTVAIRGSVSGAGLERYVVQFRPARGGWVTLRRGSGPVRDAVVARLDTTRFRNGTGTIRVVAFGDRSRAEFQVHAVRVANGLEPYLERGFPAQSGSLPAGSYHGGPALLTLAGDIDFDRQLEMATAGFPLEAWNHDGTRVSGWPPADGFEGMAYPTLAEFVPGNDGYEAVSAIWGDERITAYDGRGRTLPGWPRRADNYVATPAAAADVNGDGRDEIFLDEQSWELSARTADGSYLRGWPQRGAAGQDFDTPAIGDLDGDGDLDVVAVNASELIYAWDHSGAVLPGFPVELPFGYFDEFPVLGDVDGDGQVEIVLVAPSAPPQTHPNDPPPDPEPSVLVYGRTGTLERRIGLGDNADSAPAPALADIDEDGVPEIVAQLAESLHVVDGATGTELPGWPRLHARLYAQADTPVVGDVDGDGGQDVLTIFGGKVRAFDRLGQPLEGFPFVPYGAVGLADVVVADIDLDGRNELIVAGAGKKWFGEGRRDRLWAYDFRGPGPYAAPDWGQFGGGPKHQGSYPVTAPLGP